MPGMYISVAVNGFQSTGLGRDLADDLVDHLTPVGDFRQGSV